jgi:hypothetical protein
MASGPRIRSVKPLIVREEVSHLRTDPRSDLPPPSSRTREAVLECRLRAALARVRELEDELVIERDARADAEEAFRRATRAAG